MIGHAFELWQEGGIWNRIRAGLIFATVCGRINSVPLAVNAVAIDGYDELIGRWFPIYPISTAKVARSKRRWTRR